MAYTGQLTGSIVGKEPEVRYFENGNIVANFTISARQQKRKNQEVAKRYVKVAIWGKSAEYVGNYIHRGDSVMVTGRVEAPETYQGNDGTTKVAEKFTANEIEKFIDRTDQQQQQATNNAPPAAAPPAAPAEGCPMPPPKQTVGQQNVAAWNQAASVPDADNTDEIPF
tara:strand:+ start:2132 stop:2635 length:504 start_codon:yes stop_codon:yes gene_type:complete